MLIELLKQMFRYPDVLPYEETRVKLNAQNGQSDYINASHVKPDISNSNFVLYILISFSSTTTIYLLPSSSS